MAREVVQGLQFRKQPKGFDANKLATMLEEAYLLQKRADAYTQKKTFSPSSIGYGKATCPRYWFLAFTGGDWVDSTDAQGIANMSYGTQAHERIERLFADAGILQAKEVEILLEDPPIRGFADVLIDWEGETVIGEIKTTRSESFVHRAATMKPTAYHLFQILIYMHVKKCKIGFLLYENKNDQTFLVIPVEMNETNRKILDDAFQWMRLVKTTFDEGLLPTRPFRASTNKVCMDCPVQKTCWEELGDGEISLPKMTVPKL